MKNIAVLTYSFLFEYADEIICGITKYFENKDDVRIIIAQLRSPDNEDGRYGYQCWNLTELLKADDIDGYIILSGTFGDYIKRCVKEINVNNKPVVSLSMNLGLKGSSSIIAKPNDSYKAIISHLKNKHGCKRIAYISGRLVGTEEAELRYEAFFEAMKENDLPVDEGIVFDGSFRQHAIPDILGKKYKTAADVDFDAIFCANDEMAAGAITYLQNLGIKIPEQVKVVGFDNNVLTRVSKPSLTSIDQQMEFQGCKAAEIIYDMLNGKATDEEYVVELKPVYRQSCGCVSCKENGSTGIDENGQIFDQEDKIGLLQRYNAFNADNSKISYLLDCVHAKTTLQQYAENLPELKEYTTFKSISIILFENPITTYFGEKFVLPETASFSMEIDDDDEIYQNIDNKTFDVRKRILPEEMDGRNGIYVIYPVVSCEEFYGYLYCKITSNKFTFYDVCLKLISHTVLRALAYTETVAHNVDLVIDNRTLEEKNIGLHNESRIDELTQVLNRRGFMEDGQKLIKASLSEGISGLVFFGDLDGLKSINDTYGHKFGDIAIKTEAEILKTVFRESDVVGRLSGDEFAIVAPYFTKDDVEEIQSVINEYTKKIAEEREFKFPLSISIGYIEFNENASDLKELLAQADKALYKEKHKKHGEEYFKHPRR